MDRRLSANNHRPTSPALLSRRRIAIGTLLLAVAALGYGCFERSLKPVNPCTTSVQGTIIQVTNVDQVDLLLMVDNSNSMTEEQASVASEVPRIVTVLTSGDTNGDGMQDFMPARSLHIGIVDSDMGLGDVTGVGTCEDNFGDDGLMQIDSRHGATGCSASYAATYAATPNVFDFTRGDPARTPAQFGMDVGCVASLGTDGCGFEFELESPLKALSLTPDANGLSPVSWTHANYHPPTFRGPSYGHGSDPGTNGAFLRPDSALAIVTINDEDDCSTDNPRIFSEDAEFSEMDGAHIELNLRCHVWRDRLYPVSRYADGFLGLRANPGLLIYAAITGVPPSVAGMDPAVILADPNMQEQVNPMMTNNLLPACSVTGRGVAYPAIRMTQLAQLLNSAGAHTTIQSICANSFGPAFDEIINIVSQALSGACLGRALNPDADGNVDCDVLEVLPAIDSGAAITHCADLPNPDAYDPNPDIETSMTSAGMISREVCRIHQVGRSGAGTVPGWAYDDGNAALGAWSALPTSCGQRVGFSVISPVTGAEVRLQCNETILPSTHSMAAQLGQSCDPASTATVDCSTGHAVPGNTTHNLGCDPFVRACQVACTTTADCTGAGLLSYVCDQRAAADYFELGVPMGIMDMTPHNFCVNPTCGANSAH